MSPKEEEIALVVQRYDLPALELRHRGKECLEEATDRVAQTGNEAVEDQFREVGRGPRVALEPLQIQYLRSLFEENSADLPRSVQKAE